MAASVRAYFREATEQLNVAAMNCRDFSAALRAFADVLDIAGAPVARDHHSVCCLMRMLHLKYPTCEEPRCTSADRINRQPENGQKRCADRPQRYRTRMALGAFVQMVAEATAVTGRKKRHAAGIRDDLVAHYKQKLEAALGDDEGFAAIYNDLRTNIAMGKQEIAALAKKMTGSGARAQDTALKKICNRRQSLVVFKAKPRATAGRSAA